MYIDINDIKLNYEKLGRGPNLIMLHGNGEDINIFNKAKEMLKDYFTVYLIDSRSHGKSSKVKDLHYNEMVLDVYEFINKLDIKNPILYGFSDGGIIGLLLAIKYPNLLDKLIISGVNINPSGIKRGVLALFKFIYFFNRDSKLKMMLKEPNITLDELKGVDIPVYLTIGSKDCIRHKHTLLIKDNIKDSNLKVFENETHTSYIINSEKIADYIIEIFKEGTLIWLY